MEITGKNISIRQSEFDIITRSGIDYMLTKHGWIALQEGRIIRDEWSIGELDRIHAELTDDSLCLIMHDSEFESIINKGIDYFINYMSENEINDNNDTFSLIKLEKLDDLPERLQNMINWESYHFITLGEYNKLKTLFPDNKLR